MPKDIIPIREVSVGNTDCESLNINDYSYRAAGQRFAEQYVKKNWEKEGEITQWMWNLLYFILGAFVWEFIPSFTQLAINIYLYILGLGIF